MNKKKKNRPTLRFDGFEGEWEERTLGEVVIYKNGKSYENDICENGIINLITLNSINIDGSLSKEHKKVNLKADLKKDDIIIILSDIAHGYFLGLSAVIPENDKFTLNQRVGLLRKKIIINSYFLSTTINFNQSYFKRKGQGSSQQNLNKGDVLSFSFYLPCIKEQQKIAACLSSLDDLINAHQEKLTNLKAHKKGLLQNLFPKTGEKVPRLRFDGFKGAWEVMEVGKVFKITRGLVLSMTLLKQQSEEYPYPVFSSQTKNNGLAGFYSEYLYENAITWTTDGANAGDVNYRHGKFYCTNVCGVLLNEDGFANLCIAELINSVSKKHVSYVGNPKLMNGVMSKIKIPFPSIKEQQKIAACLSSLDDLISAQKQKIKQLQAHKKGLLQGLFPEN